MWPRVEGWVQSLSPNDLLDRLLMPTLEDVIVTILALIAVLAVCVIVVVKTN